MRLELEQNHSPMTFAENATVESSLENRAAEAADHLREGIKAAQSGNRTGARAALLRAAELDPRSESAWLWLSSISEYPEELLVFLTNVLEINPLNARALEWSAATRSLLAKNFVQRGIDAAEANQQETAVQHFNQALEYDEKNSMAWLWLASLSESNEGKLSYLEKVLEFDPENESAKTGYEAARNGIRANLLNEARVAAVNGNAADADALLEAIIAEEPDAEDAWVLRSHLANGFDAKISALTRVLEINPGNVGAKASLESLTAIMDSVALSAPVPAPAEQAEFVFEEEAQPSTDGFAAEPVTNASEEESVWEPVEPIDEFLAAHDDAMQEAAPFDSFAAESPEDFQQSEALATDGEVVDTDLEARLESSDAFAESAQVHDEVPQFTAETETNEFLEETNTEAVQYPQSADEATESFSESLEPSFSVSESESHEATHELVAEEVSFSDESSAFNADEQPVHTLSEPSEEWHEPQAATFDEPALVAPASNPFGNSEFANGRNEFATLVSIDLDPEMLAAIQSYDPHPGSEPPTPADDNGFNVPFDATMYGSSNIPMPAGDLNEPAPLVPSGFETRLFVERSDDGPNVSTSAACPFCSSENDIQAIACQGCLSILTLADLELILANQHADKTVLRQAVERMEGERSNREFGEADLTTLGIGHLNLRNLQFGYNYLHEASQKNPNNVVLSGQVNALLIRLEEIKQQDEAHQSMVKGKTILVVDDSPTVRKLIAGKLEKCGHEVVCSSDGVEAMEQLEALRPDLVLLDITMPRMDGYQVCKLIRGNAATKDVPVVMISGKDGFFDKVRGRMAGTSGYITKPFGPETLMKAVESYLKAEHAAEVQIGE